MVYINARTQDNKLLWHQKTGCFASSVFHRAKRKSVRLKVDGEYKAGAQRRHEDGLFGCLSNGRGRRDWIPSTTQEDNRNVLEESEEQKKNCFPIQVAALKQGHTEKAIEPTKRTMTKEEHLER